VEFPNECFETAYSSSSQGKAIEKDYSYLLILDTVSIIPSDCVNSSIEQGIENRCLTLSASILAEI
jgi:hypothetical protein